MVNFEDGTLVTPAHVNEDGTITPAVYNGKTPLSAYNLNNMQDVVVSATEPTGNGRKKVWFQKGKNLFDGIIEIGGYTSTGLRDSSTQNMRNSLPIKVNSSSEYIFSNNGNGITVTVCEYDSNNAFLKSEIVSANNSFTTTSTTKYINWWRVKDTSLNKIQIEQGTEITDYEEYINEKIYIKNNNVYEEFVNTEKNVLTASLVTNTTITSTDKQNLKLHEVFKLGNGFSINSDGNIVVEKNFTAVKISVNCIYVAVTGGNKLIEISFNNIQKAVSYKVTNTNITDVLTIPNCLVTNVKKGDIIYFKYQGSANDIVGRAV